MSARIILFLLAGGMLFLLVVSILDNRVINTTVLIQEGHVGRTKGNIGSVANGFRELDWNEKVGKRVAEIIERKGIQVTRVGASIPISNTIVGVAIHFDGSDYPCATGASIGHDGSRSSRIMARHWKEQYRRFYPFRWHRDNFTTNLSHYYGFNRINASKGFLVLELGEITCKKQTDWLEPRLNQVADKIAQFLLKELER